MSSERPVRRSLFKRPEKFGTLIDANGLNLVSVFFSSTSSAVMKKFNLIKARTIDKGAEPHPSSHHCSKPHW